MSKRPRSSTLEMDDSLPISFDTTAPPSLLTPTRGSKQSKVTELSVPLAFGGTPPTSQDSKSTPPQQEVTQPVVPALPVPQLHVPQGVVPTESKEFYVNFNDEEIPEESQNKSLIFEGYPLVMITCKGPVLAKVIEKLKTYLASEPIWIIFKEKEIYLEGTEKIRSSCTRLTIPTDIESLNHYYCRTEFAFPFHAEHLTKALHSVGYDDLLTFKARDHSQLEIVVDKPKKGRRDQYFIMARGEEYVSIVEKCRKHALKDSYVFKLDVDELRDALQELVIDNKDANETLTFTGTSQSLIFSNDLGAHHTYERNPNIGQAFVEDKKIQDAPHRERIGKYPFALLKSFYGVMAGIKHSITYNMGNLVLGMTQDVTEHWKIEYYVGGSTES